MARKSRKKEITPIVRSGLETNTADLPEREIKSENRLPTAAYIRLSTENNGLETDDSIQTQIMLVETYIKNHPDLKLIETYVDNGFSGAKFDRPEFVRMMDAVKKGKIQCIVVKDLSRFGRDYLETGYYIETIFPLLNIRFIAVTDNFDSFRKADRESISVPIKNMVNTMYAKEASQKQEAFRDMCEQTGRVLPHHVTYGYRLTEDRRGLEINPETESYTRMMFSWRLLGVSISEIADRLNFISAPTRFESEGKRADVAWSSSVIGKILYNPAYAGFHVMGKTRVSLYRGIKHTDLSRDQWIFFPNFHEAYITMDDYEKLNELRERNATAFHERRKRLEGTKEKLPDCFPQMVYCGECRKMMHFYRGSHSNVYDELSFQFYQCSYKAEGCNHKKVLQNFLKIIVMDQIRVLIQSTCDKDRILRKIESGELKSSSLDNARRNCTRLESKIKEFEEKTLRAYVDFADGVLDEEDYIYLKKKLAAEKESTIAKKEEADRKLVDMERSIKNFHKIAERLEEFINVSEFNENLVQGLVNRIWVYDGGDRIEVEFKSLDVFQNALVQEVFEGSITDGNCNIS